ncbi:MAG: hypothetical protein JSS56_01085 [Proteobacteria bacterium]|nr:hypothetical protein [Pseudomonadota bacterium]
MFASPREIDHPAQPLAEPAAPPADARLGRFGAAACMLDRLDTRPLAQRQRRPWWRLWRREA